MKENIYRLKTASSENFSSVKYVLTNSYFILSFVFTFLRYNFVKNNWNIVQSKICFSHFITKYTHLSGNQCVWICMTFDIHL